MQRNRTSTTLMNRAAGPLGRAFALTLAALTCSSANAQFGGFVDAASFPLGAFNGALSNSFEIGDINNDGFNDVVVAYLNFQAVSVALSDGAGGFGAPVVLSTAFRPESPRLTDVNGDGFLDLALVSYAGETVEIFLGNGTGAFTPFASVPVAEGPIDSIFADFNNDGVLDLAVAHYPLSRLDIYLGTGAGQFQYGSSALTTSEPLEIYLDDVDNDGDLDLIVSCVGEIGSFQPQSGVGMLANNGAGQFVETSFTPVGRTPLGSASGDLNGDGFLDLVTVNNDSNDYSVVLSNGAGGFHPESRMTLNVLDPRPTAAVIGDVDGDGRADLVLGNRSNSLQIGDQERADVYRQTSTGDFAFQQSLTFEHRPMGLSLSDLNGDSSPELAVIFQASLVGTLRNLTPMQAPGDFVLLTPPDGASGLPIPGMGGFWSGTSATLRWAPAAAFNRTYEVRVALDESMHTVILHETGIAGTEFTIPNGVLGANTTYYWTVVASNPTGSTPSESGVFRFSTAFPADINGNGLVDFADLNAVLSSFGQQLQP